MSKFNRDILNQNIEIQLKKKNINKSKLAEILGMSQPNVSKALNPNEKKCFTLEQVINIADYFNVTIDSLVGSPKTDTIVSANNPRDIAAFLAQCIENEKATVAEYSVEETVFVEDYDPRELFCNYKQTTQEVRYPILYFSDYWSPSLISETDEEYAELQQEAFQCGNQTGNVPINNFLRHFLQIHTLYKKGELAEETYRTVVQDLLNHVPEK